MSDLGSVLRANERAEYGEFVRCDPEIADDPIMLKRLSDGCRMTALRYGLNLTEPDIIRKDAIPWDEMSFATVAWHAVTVGPHSNSVCRCGLRRRYCYRHASVIRCRHKRVVDAAVGGKSVGWQCHTCHLSGTGAHPVPFTELTAADV